MVALAISADKFLVVGLQPILGDHPLGVREGLGVGALTGQPQLYCLPTTDQRNTALEHGEEMSLLEVTERRAHHGP